ncbi:Uu.00g093380.m01.CDS01 [Anthostomella pinea]|uniref:Uu.00g093380.m01.CDS01 n=1 Tax=Anthostomella pinea TaxID=933095 RepID=A0AAI8VP45_9PEZI|nr:Uu.00g093380.m01.CDS01 [Anthostomella pinea]
MASNSDCEKGQSEGEGAVSVGQPASQPEKDVVQSEVPASKGRPKKSLSFHLAFISLMIMVFIVSVDATALSVAIPTMSKELGGTTLEAFWANIAFMLTVTVVQPIYTSVSDIVGRKLPLYLAFFFFGLGSIIFAVGHSMGMVIAGRVLQGIGGGGLDVLNEVIIADITTLKERAFWLGLFAIPMALGTILGPILGAVFSEYVTWRWIGWLNLPLIGICLPLTIFCLRLKPMSDTFRQQLARMDWSGMGLFTVGATLFTLPLSWAGSMYPWSSWRTILPLVIGILMLAFFVWYESKPLEAVFPYRLFRNRTAAVTLLGSFIHGMVLYTLLYYLPLYFQSVFLETPLQAAVSILPLCAVLMAFTGIAAMAVEWTRRYLWSIWVGWLFLAVGVGLLGLWDSHTTLAERASFQVIGAIGIGILFTVPPIPMQASVERAEDQGLAVGILVCFRLFGGLIGLAIGATAFSTQFSRSIASLRPLPEAAAMLADNQDALSFIPYLRDLDVAAGTMDGIRDAYAQAIRSIWYFLAAFGALGFLASLLTKELEIESEETGRQAFED